MYYKPLRGAALSERAMNARWLNHETRQNHAQAVGVITCSLNKNNARSRQVIRDQSSRSLMFVYISRTSSERLVDVASASIERSLSGIQDRLSSSTFAR